MDKDKSMKAVQKFFQNVADAIDNVWNKFVQAFTKLYDRIADLYHRKEQPKNVSNIHEYLDKKKKSEPFYKSVNGNRKPWE